MINRISFFGILVLISGTSLAQSSLDEQIIQKEQEVKGKETELQGQKDELEKLKLERCLRDIKAFGLPAIQEGEEVIYHSAMALTYDEQHEQAKWVAHIITPDIKEGNISRTNDFRVDPLVKTGSADKPDYWHLGYDRGHMAPSADFRWSYTALSESYFYSNMSPQIHALNGLNWAKMENSIRDWIMNNEEQLHVVTGPILRDGLPQQGKNNLSVPEFFYKIILDNSGPDKAAIAFLMPNKKCQYPIWNYTVSIDSIEALTGIDFFPALDDEEEARLEAMTDNTRWQSDKDKMDAQPMNPEELPKGKFNTLQAEFHEGDVVIVCGTVVSTKYASSSGNTYLNLDKAFPNAIFSVTIKKDSRPNFSYKPEIVLKDQKVCIEGKVVKSRGVATMIIDNEEAIELLERQ